MDLTSEGALRILEGIAEFSERMADLSRDLAGRKRIKSAQRTIDVRRYESGLALELYVDAELADGKAVVWGIEVKCDGSSWTVEHYVRANDTQGQYSLKEFQESRPTTMKELLMCVRDAITALEATGYEHDPRS